MSNEYTQKLLDSEKKPTTDALKAGSKIAIQVTLKATIDLIGNKIVHKIRSISKKSSRELQDENEIEIPKQRYISPEKGQYSIDKLRLV